MRKKVIEVTKDITLRATGAGAPDDMSVGEYEVICRSAGIARRGRQVTAVLTFETVGRVTARGVAHDFDNVILKQWYSLGTVDAHSEATLNISPHSKYARSWSLAMRRGLKSGESPDPGKFIGKMFRAVVGYSSKSAGGYSHRNTYTRKDSRDFLRVHELIENIDEGDQTHMRSHDNTVSNSNNEHEHEARALTPAPAPASEDRHTQRKNEEQRAQGHVATRGQSTNDSPSRAYLATEVIDPDDLDEKWESI